MPNDLIPMRDEYKNGVKVPGDINSDPVGPDRLHLGQPDELSLSPHSPNPLWDILVQCLKGNSFVVLAHTEIVVLDQRPTGSYWGGVYQGMLVLSILFI